MRPLKMVHRKSAKTHGRQPIRRVVIAWPRSLDLRGTLMRSSDTTFSLMLAGPEGGQAEVQTLGRKVLEKLTTQFG